MLSVTICFFDVDLFSNASSLRQYVRTDYRVPPVTAQVQFQAIYLEVAIRLWFLEVRLRVRLLKVIARI